MNSVADQRYRWHRRWDRDDDDNDEEDDNEDSEDDSDGHKHQAEGWANRAHNIWKRRGFRSIEYVSIYNPARSRYQTNLPSLYCREEHDRIDRAHAWGPGMLEGNIFAEDDDDEYTGGLFLD